MTVEYRVMRCGCAPGCHVVTRADDTGILDPVASFPSQREATAYIRSVRSVHANLATNAQRKRAQWNDTGTVTKPRAQQ